MTTPAKGGGGEHRPRTPPAGRGGAGQQAIAAGGKGAKKPEKQLNGFVRAVALIERVGNALGTLAFTWATVVLLGGYPTVLRQDNDFWFATAIVFLEATRMFSGNNRQDYRLFFHTKGAVRPLGWNGLVVVVYLSNVKNYMFLRLLRLPLGIVALTALIGPSVVGLFQSSGALKMLSKPVRHAVSLCAPLVAVTLLVPLLLKFPHTREAITKWTALTILLFLLVLLLTISRLRSPGIIRLAEHALGRNHVFWSRVLLNICMFVELVILVFMPGLPKLQLVGFVYEVYALVLASIGNFQIPAAVARIVLTLYRLLPQDYYGDSGAKDPAKTNLAPSLNIFYWMVLAQGILYFVACLLEIFSFIPRRALARHEGFRGQCGVESIDVYYTYALEKCMEKDVLAPKKISLASFAMDSINSESPKRLLHGVRMMHNLLQMEPTRTLLVPKLKASTSTVARVIEMLDWTSPVDRAIRLSAASIVAELATSLRIITFPGFIHFVSSLLDVDGEPERDNMLMQSESDDEQEKKKDTVTDLLYDQEQDHVLAIDADGNRRQKQTPLWDTSSLLEIEARSTHQVGMEEHDSCFLGCWKWISRFCSTPQEEAPIYHDHLPALGMSILDSLCCDQDNCVEMTKVAGLIPKIIGFTSYKSYKGKTDEVQQKILLRSSLKLLKKLSEIGGDIGKTLRHKISEHPLLLRNLAEILDDRFSSQGVRKLVIGILRNLALDANTSQEIGRIQVIIGRLMDAFLKRSTSPSSKNSNQFLQKVAGQALAMLAMESADNCEAMLMEAVNAIGELASMICENDHKFVAARLLLNLFQHMEPELSNSDQQKLCETLPKVLDTILDLETEGAELEVLIGLSAQICKVIPDDFARELANGHREEIFVKRLVDVLKANMYPAVHCPEIRRVVIEQAIALMACGSRYANVFNQCCMMEALSMVKRTPSMVERYRIFLGNTGIMEHKQPLTVLVSQAKQLLCRQWVRGISNVDRQGM